MTSRRHPLPPDIAPYRDQIKAKVYSARMDESTCMQCRRWDGAMFNLDDARVTVPNHRCTSDHGCTCEWIYVMKTETEPLVSPSKDYR